jgi:hypothetical protein
MTGSASSAPRTNAGRTISRHSWTCEASLWRQGELEEKPKRTWDEVALRWLQEKSHKESFEDDVQKIRWLTPHLRGMQAQAITGDVLRRLLQQGKPDISAATRNRYYALVRAMLKIAQREWEWIEKVPFIKLDPEAKRRIRWLRPEEIRRLLDELPDHLRNALCLGDRVADG